MLTDIPKLYFEKKDCCACGACLNICPVKAISMYEDSCGFLFPQIDESICIKCGKCKLVCDFSKKSEKDKKPIKVYAAKAKSKFVVEQSSSGGIFACLAQKIIEKGY